MAASERINRLRLHSVLRVAPRAFLTFDGPLFQKSRRGHREKALQLRHSARRQLKKFEWKPPPRAKIAVHFNFFPVKHQAPELHNLCKFYLDVLEGEAFNDDRQVAYLEATLWRHQPKSGQRSDARVYVEIQKWSDLVKKIKLAEELALALDDDWDDASTLTAAVYGRSHDMISWQQAEFFQNSILFEYHHSPLAHQGPLAADFERLDLMDPFTIRLPDLPTYGESSAFKVAMANAIEGHFGRHTTFSSLRIALALDIRLTTEAFRAAKDLDNLVRSIYPVLGEMLAPHGKVNAFRAYLVKSLPGRPPDCIWLKLLPFGAIQDYNRRLKEVLEKADDEFRGW